MLRTLLAKLKTALRSWLDIPTQSTHIIERTAKSQGISIASATLERAGEKTIVHRKVQAPALLPGVVPDGFSYNGNEDPGQLGPYLAADSELVAPIYAFANAYHSGLGFPGYAYLAELSQRSEYRAPSETMAQEMTREFIKLVTKGKSDKAGDPENEQDRPENALARDAANEDDDKPEGAGATLDDTAGKKVQAKIEKLDEALREFKVRDHFRKIAAVDGFFGRAQLFIDMGVSDEGLQLPLVVDPATVKKGKLKGFKVVEPMWTTPYTYNASNPLSPDYYVPLAWFVMGRRVHASRLLTFVSREVPDMLKPAYNFGGLSMTQLMEPYVYQWLRTRNSVSDLIHNFSVMVLKTNMGTVLQGEADKPGGLLDRAKLFVETRDSKGLTLLDKDSEDLGAVNVPLSTLDKLQAQAQEHMAAPSHIPLVKLLGISPAGLNASSEGEIKVFYDYVRAMQQSLFTSHLKTVLQILQLHLFGEIDDAIDFEYISLTAPTVKELSEIRKANAETDATYIDKGVLAPDEVRTRVGQDPDSGYNSISGNAPPPPQQIDAEHGAELGEESAQANHERTLEATKLANKDKQKAA